MKRVAVITGATSGMGAEFVRQMIRYMPNIDEFWLIARRKDVLISIAERYPTKGFRLFPMDLENEESWKKYEEVLDKEQPAISTLVNAAGYGIIGETTEIDVKNQTGMIRLNCEALEAITQLSIPYMKYGSKIINVGSASAFLPQPGFNVYAASKAFVLSYSRALGRELKKEGIKVTCVCPGPVETEFFDRAEAIHKSPSYKKAFRAKKEDVVVQALMDAKHGKSLSICKTSMKLMHVAAKILPNEWILKLLYR